MSRASGCRNAEDLDKPFVDALDPVVALLVVAVYGSLNFGDAQIANVWATSNIFFVPEQKVELVLLADRLKYSFAIVVGVAFVPTLNHLLMQLINVGDKADR